MHLEKLTRRGFVVSSGIAALALTGRDPRTSAAVADTATQGGSATSYRVATTQPNDGVVLHPYHDDGIMRGSPPPPDKLVTVDDPPRDEPRARWANLHMRELWPTQTISPGLDGVIVLPRKPLDIDPIEVTDKAGDTVKMKDYLTRTKTDAFLIIKDGCIVNEQYFNGTRPDTPHVLWSAQKSIYGTTFATLMGKGELDADKPIEHYVPELAETGYRGATVRQILDMRSGVRFAYDFEAPQCELSRFDGAGKAKIGDEEVPVGVRSFLLTLEKARAHGKWIAYKESDPYVLAWAAERITDQRFADLISERIWSQLGAENEAYTTCDALGFPLFMAAALRDLGRWGLMCLQEGSLNGRQIVPRTFFRDIQENTNVKVMAESLKNVAPDEGFYLPPVPEGTGYRSFYWIGAGHGGAYGAFGYQGQNCYIFPKHQTVVVRFASDLEPPDEGSHLGWEITRALASL